MKKKFLAMVLCAAMALGLMACGGGQNGGQENADKSVMKSNKQINYSADGKVTNETETKYDEKGRETFVKSTSYDNGEKVGGYEMTIVWTEEGKKATGKVETDGQTSAPYTTYTITYDDDGNMLEKITDGNGIKNVYTYTYKDGREATIVNQIYVNDTLYSEYKYIYGEKGDIVKGEFYYSSSDTRQIIEYKYEYKDDKIQSQTTIVDGKETSVVTYTYDANGNRKGESNGQIVLEATLDKNGNTLESKNYTDGKLVSCSTYEYYE